MGKVADKLEMKSHEIVQNVDAKIEIVLDSDMRRFRNGFLRMGITDVKVTDTETKKELGSIMFSIEGTTVYALMGEPSKDGQGRRQWSISVKELWPLFVAADKKYTKEGI
jgi:hypothetical protein